MRIDNLSAGQYSLLIAGVNHVIAPHGYINVADSLEDDVYAAIADSEDLVAYSDKLFTFDGGQNLHGTYNGSIIVNGDAFITGDLIVNGSLTVLNTLNNQGGYAVSILGDMIVGAFNFTPSDPETAQHDIRISGDCYFSGTSEMHCAGGEFSFNVGGDLIGYGSSFDCYGIPGANGLYINIGGNLNISSLSCYGGDATASASAGNGGQIYIKGNLICNDELDIHGGSSSHDGFNAGSGGYLEVWENCTGAIYGNGGNADANSSAGSGMGCNIYGTFFNWQFEANGGSSNSTNPSDSAGTGGWLEVGGDILEADNISISGGSRGGTLTDPGSTGNPNAGYIYCGGDTIVANLYLIGGDNNCPVSNSLGGQGGQVYIYGDLQVGDINVSAGASVSQNGGNAGNVSVYGMAMIQGTAYFNGGASTSGSENGSCGTASFYNGVNARAMDFLDGLGDAGASSSSGVGLFMAGTATCGSIQMVDRIGVRVKGFNLNVLMSLASFGPKATFTQPNDSETLSVSALIGLNIFMYDVNNGWYNLPGTSLAD